MAEESTGVIECAQCFGKVKITSRYCKHCGATQPTAAPQQVDKNIINALVAFYLIELTVCAVVTYTDSFHGLFYLIIADTIMAVSAIAFTLFLRHDVFPTFRWNNFSLKKLFIYIAIAMVSSVIVQFSVKWINISLFDIDTYYYYAFMSYKHPVVLMLLFMAVCPALFEELAYRGFVLGALLKVVDKRQAIFISAFVFALIHLSMLSLIWLIPFALFLGYIRIKENTIWYGVVFHFTFNAVSCLFEFFELHLY